MPINLNIDGVSKNVISPETNIDGVWRQVNVVSHNINGVWRESFNRNVYKVNLYRYGVLYRTLSVTKGSSVTLPSVPTVQSDDVAHYGWTKTAGNTTRDYTATQSITPTSDMNLYAVYSYNVTEVGTKTLTCSGSSASSSGMSYTNSVVAPLTGTCTISGTNSVTTPSGGVAGTFTLGSSTSASDYCQIGSKFITGTVGYQQTAITATVTAGQTISLKITNVSDSNTSQYHTINVVYPANVTTTRYRSSIESYTINLYNGDTLYQTTTVSQGYSYTFPSITVSGKTFKGWSKTQSSPKVDYNVSNVVIPTSDMNFYAVFGYEVSDIATDGNGYFEVTGVRTTSTTGFSNNSGPFSSTGYDSYNAVLTFTNNTTKTISIGNSSGSTTVSFNSSYGIQSISVPENTTQSWDNSGNGYDSSDYEYVSGTTNISHSISIKRYLYTT